MILVNNGVRKKLMELFNCTYPTVRSALKGNVCTALSVKIRKAAIERGGIEVETKNKKT